MRQPTHRARQPETSREAGQATVFENGPGCWQVTRTSRLSHIAGSRVQYHKYTEAAFVSEMNLGLVFLYGLYVARGFASISYGYHGIRDPTYEQAEA